jgi:hypothetical protein
MERNLFTSRSVMSVGVGGTGDWTEYLDASERAVHPFRNQFNPTWPYDVHSFRLGESFVVGTPGLLGSDTIGGSGWARIFLRVKGVAHRIPTRSVSVVDGSAHENRIGVPMEIVQDGGGGSIYSVLRSDYTLTPIHTEPTFIVPQVNPILKSGSVSLNAFPDVDEFSDSTFEMDRVVSFSAQLPITYRPELPTVSWNQFRTNGFSGVFSGGSQPEGTSDYISPSALGLLTRQAPVCKNALNSTNLLTGLPLFSDPTNTIQLLVQRVGFRPESGPRPERHFDLA